MYFYAADPKHPPSVHNKTIKKVLECSHGFYNHKYVFPAVTLGYNMKNTVNSN